MRSKLYRYCLGCIHRSIRARSGVAKILAPTYKYLGLLLSCAASEFCLAQPAVDYSVVSVPEESGTEFLQVSTAADYVCMPQVKRGSGGRIDWLSNRVLDTSVDGQSIAYLSLRGNTTNIFIKDLSRQGSSTQRTNRQGVWDFAYSPDGNSICFSEARGTTNQIFLTDARTGYVCRQITQGSNDYSPVFSPDMKSIFFARLENRGVSIWNYNIENNFLSSFTNGMNPCPLPGDEKSFFCTRTNTSGRSEIWKVNYESGVEECIVSDPQRSFTSPSLSPDGQWILFVGDSKIQGNGFIYANTDLFVARVDGTGFAQLTYHAADDLSPVWSRDGQFIYFLSQRGNAEGICNIWRMNFQY